MAILIVEHNGNLEGASLSGRVLIGRRTSNHVVVDDPAVSRIHAWIDTADRQFCLTDAGSRTGTFINGIRITGKVALNDGDRIGVGPARLIFRAHETLPAGVSELDFNERDRAAADDEAHGADGVILFDCTCGAPLWIASEHAGRLGKCRYCGAVIRVPQHSGGVARVDDSLPVATTRPTQHATSLPPPTSAAPKTTAPPTVCGVCQSPIEPRERMTTCPECGLTFHADCWTENFGCSAYGCSQVNALLPKSESPAEPSADVLGLPPVDVADVAAAAPKVPPEYALLAAALGGTLLGAFAFGVPAAVVLVIILLYFTRRRAAGERPQRVALAAAALALLGTIGGAAISYVWWLDGGAGNVLDVRSEEG